MSKIKISRKKLKRKLEEMFDLGMESAMIRSEMGDRGIMNLIDESAMRCLNKSESKFADKLMVKAQLTNHDSRYFNVGLGIYIGIKEMEKRIRGE